MATGPIMAIGAVDMLIPPSALTVLLGSLSGISISKLLIGGVVPGLILSVAFVGLHRRAREADAELAPPTPIAQQSGWEAWRLLVLYVVPLIGIFAVVVGAMSGGFATPTESAALGALATMAVAALYRVLTLEALMKSLKGAAAISGMIMFIILGATTFSQILSFSGATEGLVSAILGQGLSALRRGRADDADPDLPRHLRRSGQHDADHAAGVHADRGAGSASIPIWFGVLFLICMQLGLLLPPHGLLLMTMRGVAPPEVTMAHIFQAVVPYVIMSLCCWRCCSLFPAIATWLPNRLVG